MTTTAGRRVDALAAMAARREALDAGKPVVLLPLGMSTEQGRKVVSRVLLGGKRPGDPAVLVVAYPEEGT